MLLRVLVALLLFGHPALTALTVASALGALEVRGVPLGLLLLAHLVATGVGMAAGMALAARRPGAPALAQAALALSVGVSLFTYLTPYAPNNRPPGDTPFYVAVSLLYHAGWILYLRRSRRIREQFSDPRDSV